MRNDEKIWLKDLCSVPSSEEGIIPWVRSWMRSQSGGQLHQLGVHPHSSLLHVQWPCLRWTNFSSTSCHRVTDNCATSISSSFLVRCVRKVEPQPAQELSSWNLMLIWILFVGHKSLNLRSRCGWTHIFLQFSRSLDLPWQSWCSVQVPVGKSVHRSSSEEKVRGP